MIELILFGVKGSMRTLAPARSTVNMLEARKREHSRKPDEQYDLIESCSPGPYLKMFARYKREGWSAWGNEADDTVEPRGKAQHGYAGGEIRDCPSLAPNERKSGWLSERFARILVEEYESGAPAQQLADSSGYSITRVRAVLTKGGAEFRG